MNWPAVPRPLTMTERRDLKRKLGVIADALFALDKAERQLRAERAALLDEREKIHAEVYRR
jgi:hypothetical protein